MRSLWPAAFAIRVNTDNEKLRPAAFCYCIELEQALINEESLACSVCIRANTENEKPGPRLLSRDCVEQLVE